MSVVRVHKTSDYTVMSNNHFKNKNMSLKAKGLLSLMLSLPDDWDYSIAGLVTLSSDKETSVRTALKELEELGYLKRTRVYKDGKIVDWEYNIYEENLDVENQQVENQVVGFQAQLNTKQSNTYLDKKENKKNSKDILAKSQKDKEKAIEYVYKMYENICIDLPRVRVLSESRKKAIAKLLKSYTVMDIEKCFLKANASDYLLGRVNGWKADFDWLLKEEKFVRVLEGRYDNYSNKSQTKNKAWEKNVKCEKYTAQEESDIEKWQAEMERKGEQVTF